jgi:hypothetical protein
MLGLSATAPAAMWQAISKATEQSGTTRRLVFIVLVLQLPVYLLVVAWLVTGR